MQSRLLEIHQDVLSKNDWLAQELRQRFVDAGVFVVNLLSSPGAGKTALLERTLTMLSQKNFSSAALVGDLATENDARRLARSGVPVRQIVTAGICHLEAEMVSHHLEGWDLDSIDILFIENVGNLVCPSSYDLGENMRVAMLSVTEGEDKPQKYPPLFNSADLVIITKMDLAEAAEFDLQAACDSIQAVCPEVTILQTSAKKGDGMESWLNYLLDRRKVAA